MDKILEVKKLKISFRTNNGTVKAVRDISFDLERGKTLAIVGESGSGKSVTSKAILGILAGNSIIEGGEVLYDGRDLLKIDEEEMHKLRGDKISMIFQDPLSSLNPIVKIGKQVTEAMLLKNKANRRTAKKEYKYMVDLLKDNMTTANPQDKALRIRELMNEFRAFNNVANTLHNKYNDSYEVAIQLKGELDDFIFQLEKKQEVKYSATIKDFLKKIKVIRNPYLTTLYDAPLTEAETAIASVAKLAPAKGEDLDPRAFDALKSLQSVLNDILAQEQPDFFRIGYYKYRNPAEDLTTMEHVALNEKTLEYLDSNFMGEFIGLAQMGVRSSYEKYLTKKKELIADLDQAITFYNGEFTKSEAVSYGKELTKKVEATIDLLETNKDSTAYTFGSSIQSAIEKYFSAIKFNPKEEKRFARQTAKRDRLVNSGKKVEWKVIPLQLADLDDLKEDIVSIVKRLHTHYENYIAASETMDFHSRTVSVIDYLKEKAAAMVYRLSKASAREKAIKLMDEVGIHEPRRRFYQYPFEFSGGMRQRIVIAIALAANPDVLICDEPTTALDVTIQAQILELINNLKKERNLSVIFITHDLGVVANMADDIAVMYAGKIVEYGTAEDIFYDPRHPYTWALLSSMPDLDTKEKLEAIPGTPPNMIYPPAGDAFADRNKYAMEIDFERQPPMFKISDTHSAATWLLHPDAPEVPIPKNITERIARMMSKNGGADK